MIAPNMKVIYKITYPNGKIYIGKDLTNTLNYSAARTVRLSRKTLPESNSATLQLGNKSFGSPKQHPILK